MVHNHLLLRHSLKCASCLTVGTLMALVLPMSAATAQIAPATTADAAKAEADTGRLEEIVVTAQKRRENLQYVPISISAVTERALADAGTINTTNLTRVAPGLVTFQTAAAFLPFIRGIGSTASQSGFDSSVAVYVDGVYQPNKGANVLDLTNIERIEVLKGPQGTLFGRNATGGAIDIITKTPGKTPEFNAQLGYGRYNEIFASVYASTPVSETLFVNIAAAMRKSDGYIRDIVRGTSLGDIDNKSAMIKLRFEKGNFEAILSGTYSKNSDNTVGAYHQKPGTRSTAQALGFPVALGDYEAALSFDPIIQNEAWSSSLKMNLDVGDVKLVSITGWSKSKTFAVLDPDLTSGLISTSGSHQDGDLFSQELQILSQGDGPFQWIVGAYFLKDNQGYEPDLRSNFVTAVTGIAYPYSPAQLITVPNGALNEFDTRQNTNALAAFAQSTYAFTPVDHLTLGLRYGHETKHAFGSMRRYTAVASPSGPVYAITPLITQDVSKSWNKPTWRIAYDHRFAGGIMAYASYNRGFKSGAYNTTSLSPTAVPVNPEKLDAYEVGVKSELFDHTLRLNAATFYYDFSNIQVQQRDPVVGTVRTENAARGRLYGLDLDSEFRPVPELTLTAGMSLLNTKYLSYVNASTVQPLGTLGANVARTVDGAGLNLIFAPKMTATASATYQLSLGSSTLQINGHVYHNAGYDAAVGGFAGTHVDAYTTVGTAVTWRSPDERFSLRLWAENLTGEHYPVQLTATTLGTSWVISKPVTYGTTVGVKF